MTMPDLKTTLEPDMNEGFRLSPQQQRIWLLQGLQSADEYQVNGAVVIEGNLDIERLKMAINQVMERHEILRTTFPCLPGMTIPFQQILKTSKLDWQDEDLRLFDSNKGINFLNSLLTEFNKISFNFALVPPIKFKLARLLDHKFILLIRLSALCGDSLSFNLFIQEIIEAYHGFQSEKNLAEVEIQYADIAEWFHEVLEEEEGEIGKSYWREKGNIHQVEPPLVIEKKYQETIAFKPQLQKISLSVEQQKKIEQLIRTYELSYETFFLASFALFLAKITGKSNFSIGNLVNGRSYEELEQGLGLFAKYLPHKAELLENSTFLEIWQTIQLNHLENKKWQDYFTWDNFREKLIDSSQNFFAYCFDWYTYQSSYQVEDLSFTLLETYSCLEPFKLKLVAQYDQTSFNLAFHYDANKFDKNDIKTLLEQYQNLLKALITQPHTPSNQLTILSALDKQKILSEFNQTNTNYPHDKLIHQQFEKQVKHTPKQVAVIDENQSLTYEQLNQKANQLAHYLIKKGVKPDSIIPLFVERSLEFIIGMLAILKAGGAYLALDTTLPQEALKFRLEDANATLIITQQPLNRYLRDTSPTVINIDDEWDIIAQEPKTNPSARVHLNSLVYVIYTSGSTGKPKGVAVEHQQLCNYVYSIQERLELPSNGHFANVSSFAADLGNTGIFPPLCSGGCVHIISQDRMMDAEGFAEYCNRHPIDCLKIVPSHLSTLLIAAKHPEKILPSKRLILGGEALNWQLISQIKQYAPHCPIYNHYGPTETTIGVLTNEVTTDKPVTDLNTVPLGRPIGNTQIYILDKYLEPVPIGVPGELYIGGNNLSRGYLNQPKLTAERFIENPFKQAGSREQGAREKIYKTGDLARYLPDGTIEFLGRIDRQIKIRGFRIELGEIEAILRQYSDIQAAVVMPWEASPGNTRLVAYLVNHSSKKIENAELSHFLAQKLPEFMIPNHFLWLETLPLTANGKINYAELPSPDRSSPDINYIAPRNDIEEILADIWAELLSLEKVGISHSFFDLGGHSLLATQLISRIRQTFRTEITLRDLFDDPTIGHLAQTLVSHESKPGQSQKIAQTLKKLKTLSPEEKQQLLAQKRQGGQL